MKWAVWSAWVSLVKCPLSRKGKKNYSMSNPRMRQYPTSPQTQKQIITLCHCLPGTTSSPTVSVHNSRWVVVMFEKHDINSTVKTWIMKNLLHQGIFNRRVVDIEFKNHKILNVCEISNVCQGIEFGVGLWIHGNVEVTDFLNDVIWHLIVEYLKCSDGEIV